jgi:hypothetical protein
MLSNPINKKQKWFNRAQLEAMEIAACNEFIVASRGFGKSEGIDAPRLLRNVLSMPRSTGALLSPTYAKLLSNTLPAVCAALDRMGYKRNVHYLVGRKPPKELNYKRPLVEPFKWDYVMSWFNGSIVNLISFDRPMSANSMNLDWILGFESKYLNYNKIVNEVFPANRGNENLFGLCPWHHGMVFTTDMPTFKSGMWILDKKNDMDKDLIDVIRRTYSDYILFKELPDKTDQQNRKMLLYKKELDTYRKNATFYAEYDIFDNLEIIGEARIRNLKRELPPFIFQTSILNVCPRKVPNGFYSALSEKLHVYEKFNNEYLESLSYESKNKVSDCRVDGDLNHDAPLRIAFDYNAAINNVVTGQIGNKSLMVLNWQFVKTPRKLQEMCNEWCDYYHYFGNRDVIYYYDATAIAKSADGDAKPFYEIVTEILIRRGWNVNGVYIGQPMRHATKHEHIDMALKGNPEYLFPQFNKHNTEFLFMALEQTGIKYGRNGFEKDKGSEKTEDSPDNPDELKTHGTDAFDTLFIGCQYFDVTVISGVPTSSTW